MLFAEAAASGYPLGVDLVAHFEIFLGLLAGLIILAVVAQRFNFPYPILLVIAGAIIAAIPDLPTFTLDPEIAFIVFLPPLIFSSAWLFPWDEFRSNLRRIVFMAVVLVLLTMAVVGLAAWWMIPGMTLAAACVLGAVVSPPDAVAATAILKNISLPRRVINVLEGESLVNDASGLVAYQVAVAAVVTGVFSFHEASLEFVWMAAAGIAVGLGIGFGTRLFCRLVQESAVEITLLFVMPFLAYLAAEAVNASGVLAVVAIGMYLGHRKFEFLSAESRLQSNTFWTIVTFILNGVVFLLIGLEIPMIVDELRQEISPWLLGFYAIVICALVIASRFLIIFMGTWIFHGILTPLRFEMDQLKNSERVVLGWAGMRGVVSLAAALAIPRVTDAGHAFPDREIILFLTCAVIFVTLTLNGLTLPILVKRLGVSEKSSPLESLDLKRRMYQHTITYIDSRLASEKDPKIHEDLANARDYMADHLRIVESRIGRTHSGDFSVKSEFLVVTDLLNEQRRYLREQQAAGKISDHLRSAVEHEIDLEEHRVRSIIGRLSA